MDNNNFFSVGILVQHGTAELLLRIAETMRTSFGSTIHLFVRSELERAHYERLNDGRWASVVNTDVMSTALFSELDDGVAVVDRARGLERRFDITIGELMLGHRHLGRGFSPLGTGLPLAPSYRDIEYPRVLHAYSETLEFWERALSERGITLLLQGSKEAMVVARRLGIANRRLSVARYRDHWYWGEDEYQSLPALRDVYLRMDEAPAPDLDRPYGMNLRKRDRVRARKSAIFALKSSLVGLAHWLNWWLRRRDTLKKTTFKTALLFPWQWYFAHRSASQRLRTRLSDIKGRDFIYVPLQKEPEAAFQLRSPEYFSQHSLIMSFARDVPAGVLIAVKENLAGLGQRPLGFYQQLQTLPNVVLLDPEEAGLACARAAKATAVIVGTAGFEAAVYGWPVISFGRHSLYGFLPHVLTVTDEAQLKGYLRQILSGDIDLARAENDGARFLAALVASSFDTGDVLRGGNNPKNMDDVCARAFDMLVRSLPEIPVKRMAIPR